MAITQLPSGLETLLIEADFFSISHLTVFSYWIEPALLQQWWPQQADALIFELGNALVYHR